MDQTDAKILKELNHNSRLKKNQIARLVHLTPPAVATRIEQMEDAGIIQKYTIEVDPTKLGYTHQVFIQVEITHFNHRAYRDFIHKKRNFIRHHYKISGQTNYLIQAAFHSSRELDTFVTELEPYGNYQIVAILEELI